VLFATCFFHIWQRNKRSKVLCTTFLDLFITQRSPIGGHEAFDKFGLQPDRVTMRKAINRLKKAMVNETIQTMWVPDGQ
jgi:hypothetical protein